MNNHYIINLGRQLGSGGKEIGEKLAKDLGIAFYDKELINLASKESGLCNVFRTILPRCFAKLSRLLFQRTLYIVRFL